MGSCPGLGIQLLQGTQYMHATNVIIQIVVLTS